MKVRIEFDDSLDQVEVIIRASQLGPEIEQIQQVLGRLNRPSLVFYKGTSEFFLKLEDLLFFETDGTKIFAHTGDDAYEVKMKLYELEEHLPIYFCRVAKSTIVNSKLVYSLNKSFSGTSRISFYKTHKEVHVSRHYYHLLKEKLQEMR
ncbi:LytTR family transcriptional regulator [Streptococcus suis]|nr:LytTR family transcriptional regulator [Streptococcus suis]